MSPPDRLLDAFRRAFGREAALCARAPGRVDLIGAHIDYNDGHVMPMAIDRDAWVAAAPAPAHGACTVVALDLGETATFDVGRLTDAALRRRAVHEPGPSATGEARRMPDLGAVPNGLELPGWARYPAGVAWSLASAGVPVPAIDAVLSGDVPVGAGLSSSAAVEVAFAVAWRALGGWDLPAMDLARLCRRAENEYVGVACGLMDQFASVFGQTDHALLLDCRTLDWQPVPIPADVAVVVADTATRRQLADGALNVRQAECQSALVLVRVHLPGIAALRDVTPAEIERIAPRLPEPERSRARHVVAECARVLATANALRDGDAERVGRLMDESHVSARDLYAASGPALEAMWAAAHVHEACLGGRFIGAGFAGCLAFLVRRRDEAPIRIATSERFTSATGIVPRLFVVRASAGADVVAAG